MNKKMIVPGSLHVGFCHRYKLISDEDKADAEAVWVSASPAVPLDQFLKNLEYLSFIVFYDKKRLRSEVSWNQWRDNNIEPVDVDNVPMSGFQIVGTDKRSTDWFGSGKTMFLVRHPHGFRFEISSNNLLEILRTSTVTSGLIHGDCILAWSGRNLALLPTSSDEYRSSVEHTSAVSEKSVKEVDLEYGKTYFNKAGDKMVYLGAYQGVSYKATYDWSSYSGHGYTYNMTASFTDCLLFVDEDTIGTMKSWIVQKPEKHSYMSLTPRKSSQGLFLSDEPLDCPSQEEVHKLIALRLTNPDHFYISSSTTWVFVTPAVDRGMGDIVAQFDAYVKTKYAKDSKLNRSPLKEKMTLKRVYKKRG